MRITVLLCFVCFTLGAVTCGAGSYWYGLCKGYERIIGDMQARTVAGEKK